MVFIGRELRNHGFYTITQLNTTNGEIINHLTIDCPTKELKI